ncbi:hypothetical protein SNE40_014739 [Patella caerulea]|uniref:RanBP2-type domain-containing protein n=1 Tax=Patella caerulea TaxID=87958 RepID=A0AAN8JHI6_PATCE
MASKDRDSEDITAWECQKCTYINSKWPEYCELCFTENKYYSHQKTPVDEKGDLGKLINKYKLTDILI